MFPIDLRGRSVFERPAQCSGWWKAEVVWISRARGTTACTKRDARFSQTIGIVALLAELHFLEFVLGIASSCQLRDFEDFEEAK